MATEDTNTSALPDDFQPDSAWIVYAAGYTGAPQSLFGHVFLVFGDAQTTGPTRWAVQFAAEVEDGIGLSDAVRGLFGSLQGRFTVTPYYQLIRGYRNIEMRDLWEYRLQYTPERLASITEFLKTHSGDAAPYNFAFINCSDGIFNLVHKADAGKRLKARPPIILSPLGLLRLLRRSGALGPPVYYPSLASSYKHHWANLVNGDRVAVRQFTDYGRLPDLIVNGELVKAAVIARLQADFFARQLDIDEYDARIRLLQEIPSEVPGSHSLTTGSSYAETDPSRSPPPRAVSLLAGRDQTTGKYIINARLGYHDYNDPYAGMMPWSSVRLLDATVEGVIDGKARPVLSECALLSIESLDPGADFRRLNAWRFLLDYRRRPSGHAKAKGTWRAETGIGRSFLINDQCLAYGMVAPSLNWTGDSDSPSLWVAGEAGLVVSTNAYAGRIRIQYQRSLNYQKERSLDIEGMGSVMLSPSIFLDIKGSSYMTDNGSAWAAYSGIRLRF